MIGGIVMILGALLFAGGVVAAIAHSGASAALMIAGAAVFVVGFILSSIGEGGFYVILRLVGGTTDPSQR
ncbi:MAG TPA: hypothetical protein VND45_00160 [Thermoanaerobaculia bacterium]|nr:hypothetical protein [Thermoanaerobaculia bacterium]